MILSPLQVVIIVASLLWVFFAWRCWRFLSRLKLLKAGRNFCAALLMFLTTASAALFLIAHHGYRSFTREELAARVCIEHTGTQQFTATVVMPDSTRTKYECQGDQLYIDAHILKWHPWVNLFGVHTTYELDRIGGRFFSIEDEKTQPHTVYALSAKKWLDMFHIRQKWKFLHPLLDAYYGSGTFIATEDNAVYDVMVATSGLLIRNNKQAHCR